MEMLGREFDLEIIETHHRIKKDAPSGTAKTRAEVLRKTRKIDEQISMNRSVKVMWSVSIM
jgi:4-hydroxy-tetrahydrodipicolinate reductase